MFYMHWENNSLAYVAGIINAGGLRLSLDNLKPSEITLYIDPETGEIELETPEPLISTGVNVIDHSIEWGIILGAEWQLEELNADVRARVPVYMRAGCRLFCISKPREENYDPFEKLLNHKEKPHEHGLENTG